MKMFQDRCVAQEGVISRLRECQEIQNKEQEQYKEVVRTLKKELTVVTKKLKEESRLREKVQKAKVTELMALREQTKKAKVDTVVEFKASQSFIDACAIQYGESFDDYLKQVGSVYLDLDLSKISINDLVPETPAGDDTVSEETNGFTHTKHDLKDGGIVLSQPALEKPITPLVLSAEDPPTNDAENPSTLDAQNPSIRDAENPSPQDAQNPLAQF